MFECPKSFGKMRLIKGYTQTGEKLMSGNKNCRSIRWVGLLLNGLGRWFGSRLIARVVEDIRVLERRCSFTLSSSYVRPLLLHIIQCLEHFETLKCLVEEYSFRGKSDNITTMRIPATRRMIKGVPKTKSKANGLSPLFSLPFILYSILFVIRHLMSQGFWDVEISGRVGCGGVRVCRTWSILSQYLGIEDPERVRQGNLVCCTSFNVS